MNQITILKPTNYLDEYSFYNKFLFWIPRLDVFHCRLGRPPMSANDFITAFRVDYECGLRIGELANLEKRDFNLNTKLLTIREPKTGHRKGKMRSDGTFIKEMIPQVTTILPYSIDRIEKHLLNYSSHDKVFPASRMTFWRYAKRVGLLAGLNIFEMQKQKTIDGLWTHAFRKACSKRMRDYGADRELRMLKLRHAFKDAHDAYDNYDIYSLLEWEERTFNFGKQNERMVTQN